MERKNTVIALFIVSIVATSLLLTYYIYDIQNMVTTTPEELKTFRSKYDIDMYIAAHTVSGRGGFFNTLFGGVLEAGVTEKGGVSIDQAPNQEPEYSLTNVQVEGIDEMDYVKTDGQFIYIVNDNEVYIVKAYPPTNVSLISKIKLVNETVSGIYIYKNRLVLLVERRIYWIMPLREETIEKGETVAPEIMMPSSAIYVYNLTDPYNPRKYENITFPGWISNTRLMNGILYSIVNEPTWIMSKKVMLPSYIINGENYTVSPSEIYYTENKDYGFQYTLMFTLNLDTSQYDQLTILTGFTNILYMSYENIYLTQTLWHVTPFEREAYCKETTRIYKFNIQGLKITPSAIGEVFGVINTRLQLDEYNNYLRVSTYGWEIINKPEEGISNAPASVYESYTNIFILDDELNIIGSLTKIAESEYLYATRFTGDYAYLVTFRRIDPFFVVKLTDPKNPIIIGKLKIPGFSTMLQPLWNNLVLGIGYEQNNKTMTLNLKLSLFDISDPANPKEIGKFIYNKDNWGWSSATYDLHAILKVPTYSYVGIPVEGPKITVYNEGKMLWSNAYLIVKATEEGLEKVGLLEIKLPINETQPFWISYMRGIFIGDTLYIVTNNQVSIYKLDTLTPEGYILLTP